MPAAARKARGARCQGVRCCSRDANHLVSIALPAHMSARIAGVSHTGQSCTVAECNSQIWLRNWGSNEMGHMNFARAVKVLLSCCSVLCSSCHTLAAVV